MKKHVLAFAAISIIFTSLTSCRDGENREENEVETMDQFEQTQQDTINEGTKELEDTQLVQSGTYTGTAIIVDSEQNEIYVRLNDTTTIELYFSEETQVMQDNQRVGFDALQEGQTVEVEVERSGESLNPKMVRIVDNSQ